MTNLKGLEKEIENFDRKLSSYISTHKDFKAEDWVSQKEYMIALGRLVSEVGWTILQEFSDDS